MTDGNDARMEHPDELLAGYVDGSASSEERRAVDSHLPGCPRCRDELALARMARSALMSLPELDAPGLAAQGIESLRRGEVQPAERRTERIPATSGLDAGEADELAERRAAERKAGERRQWQVSWAAVAGVAAVLALLAVVPLLLNRGGGARTATGPARGAVPSPAKDANYPPVFDRSSDYDQASIRALAQQLGEDARRGAFEEDRTSASQTRAPLMAGASPRLASVSAQDVVRCALQGTGLPADTIPVYLETATYRGTPAFVVAVQTEGGTRSHLRVYAVSRQGCSFLYEADQPF
jgi:hypothetical protein